VETSLNWHHCMLCCQTGHLHMAFICTCHRPQVALNSCNLTVAETQHGQNTLQVWPTADQQPPSSKEPWPLFLDNCCLSKTQEMFYGNGGCEGLYTPPSSTSSTKPTQGAQILSKKTYEELVDTQTACCNSVRIPLTWIQCTTIVTAVAWPLWMMLQQLQSIVKSLVVMLSVSVRNPQQVFRSSFTVVTPGYARENHQKKNSCMHDQLWQGLQLLVV